MAPIRKGDGTPLEIPGVSEVRSGDGRVFFDAIPDSGMFQDPIYQWWGAAGVDNTDWTDQLAEITASAVGSPNNQEIDGFEAWDYDGVDDAHNWSSDSQFPTGGEDVSVAALVQLKDASDRHTITWWGDDNNHERIQFRFDDANVEAAIRGEPFASGSTTVSTNEYVTVGFSLSNDPDLRVYLNGSEDASATDGDVNVQDTNHAIGYDRANSSDFGEINVAEVIVSSAQETEQAFSDYHNDRLG